MAAIKFTLVDASREHVHEISDLEGLVDSAIALASQGLEDIFLAADDKILFPVGHSTPQFGGGFSKEANAIMGVYDREGMSWPEFRAALRMCGVPLGEDEDAVRELGMSDTVLAAAQQINARRKQMDNYGEDPDDAA